jgi:hypothetical protein
MDWKSFFIQLAAAAAAGALEGVGSQLGQNPYDKPIQWRPVGNGAIIGAILGALTHISTHGVSQPQTPATTAPAN